MRNLLRSLTSTVSIILFMLALAKPTVLAADQEYAIVEPHEYLFEKAIETLKKNIPNLSMASGGYYSYKPLSNLNPRSNVGSIRFWFDGYLYDTPGKWSFIVKWELKKHQTQFGRKKLLQFKNIFGKVYFMPYGKYPNRKVFYIRKEIK